jgi:hypothetical protein
MRNFCLLCCFFLLLSCDWLGSTEAKTQKLVEDELRGIDWNEVDQYPLFEGCDETTAKAEQKICFENTLMQSLSMHVQDFHFSSDKEIQTTFHLDFLVDQTGEITIVEIENDPTLEDQLPEFNKVITSGLKSIPKPAPALKRGVPVRTRFRLPLEITTQTGQGE